MAQLITVTIQIILAESPRVNLMLNSSNKALAWYFQAPPARSQTAFCVGEMVAELSNSTFIASSSSENSL